MDDNSVPGLFKVQGCILLGRQENVPLIGAHYGAVKYRPVLSRFFFFLLKVLFQFV